MAYPLSIIVFLLTLITIYGQNSGAPWAEASLTSHHLVPGESCHLIVRMRNGEPDIRPAAPEVTGASVVFVKSVTQVNQQRQLTTAFLYRVTPLQSGKITIPPISIRSHGITYSTPPQPFHVHPFESLTPLPSGIRKHQILVGWFPEKKILYQGEQCPITLKLYIPQQLPVALNGWGLPDAKKDNCLAWRFSLPQNNTHSEVTIDGVAYQSSTLDTTLSGITPGTATFGPAPLRIIVRQSVIDPRRGSRLINTPIKLTLPAVSFKILPLPMGAPPSFHGAVGEFTIQSSSTQSTMDANEPTEVIIQIKGRGNLEILQAPELTGEGWKMIDSTKITRGDERRNMRGRVTFRQLLRPLTGTKPLPTAIPPYELSYFNPTDSTYHTLKTDPLPVHINPSPQSANINIPVAEKLGTAPEEMRNILGFIKQPQIHPASPLLHSRLWQVAPAALALLIISIPLRKKIKAATTKHPDAVCKQSDLAKLAKETNQRTFYRSAGRFIEQWLSHRGPHQEKEHPQQQELQKILTERDNLCFQSEEPEEIETSAIDPSRKKAILDLLKRSSKLTLILCLFFIQSTHSLIAGDALALARDAWKSGDYQQSIDFYHNAYPDPAHTPADILYNIGNCQHRLKQPGLAALAWRQALIAQPNHPQARQNLRYIELEQGSIVPRYDDWQRPLTIVSPQAYQILFEASLWVFALALLTLIILRPRGIKTTLCIFLLVITPVTATLGAMARHWYPDDHAFAPPQKQSIALHQTILYHEAHRDTKVAHILPIGSITRINAVRGPWTHVTTADQKTGWLPSDQIHQVRAEELNKVP